MPAYSAGQAAKAQVGPSGQQHRRSYRQGSSSPELILPGYISYLLAAQPWMQLVVQVSVGWDVRKAGLQLSP